MPTPLTKEVHYVQNPALGAALLWRFAVGYTAAHSTSDSPIIPLAFLVPPILLYQDTFELLRGTQKPTGLHGFVDKFSRAQTERSDVLLSIHNRADAMRELTIASLRAAIRHKLLTVVTREAKLIPLSMSRASGFASSIKQLLDGADKFGAWCAQMTPFEVASALKVSL